MRRAFMAFIGIVSISLSSCGALPTAPVSPASNNASEYSIITSTSILADMTSNIVGDVASVTSLVGADSDAHVYEPTPEDGVRIAKATALVANGLEFEPWFEELYTASGSKAPYIEASVGITPLAAAKEHDAHADEATDAHADEATDVHADEATDAHAHEHGEFDPHVWQDVKLAIAMVTQISTELITVMPEHTATIQANTAEYVRTLEALDAEIASQIAQIPAEKRVLVTNHDTMSYFAQRYGLTVVGTVLGSVSTESSDPAASDITQLVAEIKASGAPAIFVEAFGNEAIIETIANEAGVVVAPALYTDALGSTGSAGQTYVEMMRYNSETIYQALGATANE